MARARKAVEDGVEECKVPGCENPGNGARGQCKSCYKRFNLQVKSGETTWEKIIRKGWAKKAYPPRSPASKAIASL